MIEYRVSKILFKASCLFLSLPLDVKLFDGLRQLQKQTWPLFKRKNKNTPNKDKG